MSLAGKLGPFRGITKLLLLATMATLANGSTSRRNYDETKIAHSGITVLSADSPLGVAKVVIRTTVFDHKCTCQCAAERTLRALGLKEMLIVASGDISIGSRSIIVPDSVFDRLFRPHEASLRFENGTFVLRIDGGDAANSYFVLIYFDHAGVNRRLDYFGEVPDKPTGDMHYFRVEIE